MRWKIVFSALLMLAAVHQAVLAHGHKCKSCGKKICIPEPKIIKVKKVYFDIEPVEICIPKARFLWGKKCNCPPPKCGKVRTVNRLVIKELEIEKCVYEWKVLHLCDECQHHCPPEHCGQQVIVDHPIRNVPHNAKIEKLPLAPLPKK